jgi:cytochrome P450
MICLNSRKDIKASVVDYIIAGVDTIGNSIIFTIALIAKHPNVQKKLQQELDHFFSSG